jgi:hypothetical protein
VFAAPRLQLTLISAGNVSHLRISLNERKKQFQISGKGHNELLEIVNPVKQTIVATDAVYLHVSENRGRM